MFRIAWLCLLPVLAAGALNAQYTRTQTTGTYTQRTGTGIACRQLSDGNWDDNAMPVALPFSFQYFDRAYTTVWMGLNGRVTFKLGGATAFSIPANLNTVVSPSHRNTVFLVGADLFGREGNISQTLQAYAESDRVVLQWRDVAKLGGSMVQHLNFQLHLLMNGNMEMHYGPEVSAPGYTYAFNYVSGAVNLDGTATALGFGNSTAQQTARPAAGTIVTLTLTAAATNTVTINQNPMPQPRIVVGAAFAVTLLSFRLVASGTGTTVTSLTFSHPDFQSLGCSVSLSLTGDQGVIGEYEGEAFLGTPMTANSLTTVSSLSLALTAGQSMNLLLVASSTTIVGAPLGACACVAAMPATVTGDAVSNTVRFVEIGMAYVLPGDPVPTRPAATAGSTRQRIMSFSVVQDTKSPAFSFSRLEFNLNLSGITLADITNVQLWQDAGVAGEWDAADVLLASGTAASTFSMSGFTESSSVQGKAYLLTIDISAAFAGAGTVQVSPTTPPVGAPAPWGMSAGDPVIVSGTSSCLVIRQIAQNRLSTLTAALSETGVIASQLELYAASGAGTVSSLTFQEALFSVSHLSDARLYLDAGTVPGRLDAGDTLVPVTATLNAGNFNLVLTTPLSITSVPTRLLVMVDIASNATADMRFDLAGGNVASTFMNAVGAAYGTYLTHRAGSANGVDLSLTMLNTVLPLYTDNHVPVAVMSLTPRGSGGSAPYLSFGLLDTPCGRGAHSHIIFEAWLEGAGPTGQLDASDIQCYGFSSPNDGVYVEYGNTMLVPAGQTRNFLIVARFLASEAPLVRGPFQFEFRGFGGGTDTAWMPTGTQPYLPPITTISHGTATPHGGGGSDDDGGCSTGQGSANWLGLMAGLAALAVASRLRRAIP
ncbi:MAG: hypothetical protein KF754_01855 [Planctomycetes bacterium]|nr:hypothetical protein [Planctomycetota bacterium]